MDKYLSRCNRHYISKCEFRAINSTEQTAIELLDLVVNGLNDKYFYAMDMESGDIVKSYPTESYSFSRKFIIFITYSSNIMLIKCCLPQGSVLGPLLLFIFINIRCNFSHATYTILFAADILVVCDLEIRRFFVFVNEYRN